MDDDKPDKREVSEELDVEDLDVNEAEAEALKGGATSGGDFTASGGFKHAL